MEFLDENKELVFRILVVREDIVELVLDFLFGMIWNSLVEFNIVYCCYLFECLICIVVEVDNFFLEIFNGELNNNDFFLF